jgi:hypothetical protein
MRLTYPLLPLLFILYKPVIGSSQKNYDHVRHAKKFSKRNRSYDAHYKGNDGRGGRNGLNFFNFFYTRGSDGGSGGKGPALQVEVSGIPVGDSVILAIDITKDGDPHKDHFYVNPKKGKIRIFAEGGSGGRGGDGNDVTLRSGYNGGNGGAGGTINITYDSSALPYVDCECIVALNPGGRGGDGGAGGRSGNNSGATGASGLYGASGPAVYIKDRNGNVLKMITDVK